MRLLGITIPDGKRAEYGLTALFGVGHSRAKKILGQAKVIPTKFVKEITTDEENAIRRVIETFSLEGDLKRAISGNIKRIKDIKTYRGTRHSRNLPVRGQRTKTNSRTRRGNVRKTMGTGRRAVDKK
ncbi:MAG: 30S ribosomal protein S13 [bacterium]|nr:30S ribosomal protein S13 [bacterium]